MDNLYETQDKDLELELTEEYFYPPEDNRSIHMYKGKEFEEYAECMYDLYEYEGFYEN